MRKLLISFILSLFLSNIASGQTMVTGGMTAPSGACTTGIIVYVNWNTGEIYNCVASTWNLTTAFSTMAANFPISNAVQAALDLKANVGEGGGSIPAGLILLSLTACPATFSEVTELNGRFALGTIAANSNVGTTGGSDNITPAGTISAITDIINHTHTISVNDPGHAHTQRHFPTATGGSTGNTIDTSMSGTQTNQTLTTATATTGVTASSNNPAGGVSSITPTFTGTQFDNRSAFIRVIFCKKD